MMRRLRRGGFTFDIVWHWKKWFVVSGVLLAVSLGSLLFRGLNLGMEFTGGTAFELQAASADVDTTGIRTVLNEQGIVEATVQRVGDRGFLVQTAHLGAEVQREVSRGLAEEAGIEPLEVSIVDVGPRWGQQITNMAIRALLIFLVVAVIYISIRLEPKMAGAAMVALIHDLLLTAGIYSLTGFQVTPATMIAFLTILGYSLYDTVVIFDRVKERTSTLSASGSITYSGAANGALNSVLVRSLNTSITSVIPTGSLLFVGSFLLGAQTLRELALALFIGMAAGTYSSLFVATPVLALWKEREERWEEAMEALSRYSWPGNIRELDNIIARAVILSPHEEIGPDQLPLSAETSQPSGDVMPIDPQLAYHDAMEQYSRAIILRALRDANGSQTKAAEQLKLQRTYLARLIRQKNIAADPES
jgi:preprotein translocase subunit SecF